MNVRWPRPKCLPIMERTALHNYKVFREHPLAEGIPPQKSAAQFAEEEFTLTAIRAEMGELPLAHELSQYAMFPIYIQPYKSSRPEVIHIHREELWSFLRPFTRVLLSDGVTHHYTWFLDIDEDSEVVSLLEPWPQQCFLRKGHNVLGMEAIEVNHSTHGPLIGVFRTDFERLLCAFNVLDDGEISDRYLDMASLAMADPSTYVALGLAHYDKLHVYPFEVDPTSLQKAVTFFDNVLSLSESLEQEELNLIAAAKRQSALLMLEYLVKLSDRLQNPFLRDSLAQQASNPPADYSLELERKYEARDYLRLALLSVNHDRSFDTGLQTLTRGIASHPTAVQLYMFRAHGKNRIRDYDGAYSDATAALELLRKEEAILKCKIDEARKRDWTGTFEVRLVRLARFRVIECLEAQCNSLLGLNDPSQALKTRITILTRKREPLDSYSASLREGFEAYERNDKRMAYKHLYPYAQRGHRTASRLLGNLYAQGPDTRDEILIQTFHLPVEGLFELPADPFVKDKQLAFECWTLAAKQGDKIAMYNIALMQMHGDGVEENRLEGLNWLELSAAKGHTEAQTMLENLKTRGGLE